MLPFTIFCAKYLVFAGPLIVAVVFALSSTANRRTLALRSLATGLLCVSLAYIAGDFYYDPRPFVSEHIQPLIAHGADNGFPSDHTLVAAACAFVLLPYSLVGACLAVVATLFVAWARVASHLHTPLDVAASVAIAGIASIIAKVLVRRRPKQRAAVASTPTSASTNGANSA